MKNYGLEISAPVTITTDNTHDLGSASYKFATAYATTWNGTATTATYADLAERYTCKDSDLPVGTVVQISKDKEFDVEPAEQNSGWIRGVISENPAFLMDQYLNAEVIETKREILLDGTTRDVPSKWQWDSVIVALVGKVPVRVIGPVHKRDILVAAGDGLAKTVEGEIHSMLGYAAETNLNPEEKIVKVFLQIK